jgi:hypothetical protein
MLALAPRGRAAPFKLASAMTSARPTPLRAMPLRRRLATVVAVATPSGAGAGGEAAATAPSWLAQRKADAKHLITPFSDPAANSKLLALCSGKKAHAASAPQAAPRAPAPRAC